MTGVTRVAFEEIGDLLKEPVSSVKDRERTELTRVLEQRNNRVVLFGAGNLGKRSLACLRSIGIEPLAISDNNPAVWGSAVDGCKVSSPEEVAGAFGSTALFIVTIWNTHHLYGETQARLQRLGCTLISSMGPVYWRFADEFLPYFSQDLSYKVYEDNGLVLEASNLWADDASKLQYLRQIRARALGDWSGYQAFDKDECYFPQDLFRLSELETFVDCGAFDGDTIAGFLRLCCREFKSILAIEADALTYPKLQSFVEGLESSVKRRITARYCAVGSSAGIVRFESDGSVDAKVGEHGTTEVECFRLDDLLRDSYPTHIKMDIEGAEYESLLGARETIVKCRPVLAVCVYHLQNDIWRIPLLIRGFAPDYRFYLRMYEGDGWQTVCYAVPPERSLS